MLGRELAAVAGGLRRLLYSTIGILDVDERIWEIHIRRRFFPILSSMPPARILDAGCGEGLWSFELAREFPHHQLLGVDIRPDVIELCNRLQAANSIPNAHFDTQPFTDLIFDCEFDAILSFFSLHYSYRNDVDVLERFAGALKPGGWLFMMVPVAHQLWEPASWIHPEESGSVSKYGIPIEYDEFRSHYSRQELCDKLSQAGFVCVEIHRLAGRYAQWAKRIYASASHQPVLGMLIWPFAITLGLGDSLLPAHNGMTWLVIARKSTP